MVVQDGVPLTNFWPFAQRLRQTLLRPLPVSSVNILSHISASRFARESRRS